MTFRHFIYIKKNFFCSIQRTFFSGINWVILPSLVAGYVIIPVQFVRNRFIILLYSSLHFLKKIYFKLFYMLSHCFVIFVFVLQIINDFFILWIIEPIIIIYTNIAMSF